MSAAEKQDEWQKEIRIRFDADELALFFDAFAPLEIPFEPEPSPPSSTSRQDPESG